MLHIKFFSLLGNKFESDHTKNGISYERVQMCSGQVHYNFLSLKGIVSHYEYFFEGYKNQFTTTFFICKNSFLKNEDLLM